jgi:hypothetical protein
MQYIRGKRFYDAYIKLYSHIFISFIYPKSWLSVFIISFLRLIKLFLHLLLLDINPSSCLIYFLVISNKIKMFCSSLLRKYSIFHNWNSLWHVKSSGSTLSKILIYLTDHYGSQKLINEYMQTLQINCPLTCVQPDFTALIPIHCPLVSDSSNKNF